jgi:dolichol-phosphate mannosyltransferase
MTIFLTLPAYNEEAALPQLLESFKCQMHSAGYEGRVVVVDDGSTDGTGRIVQEWSSVLRIDLIRHEVNTGLGKTIEDGLRRAAELAHADDVIITMDADNTHSPSLIPAMVRGIQQGHDVVIASRYRRGSKVLGLSWMRQLMTYGARFLYQMRFPIPGVRDYTCGFRAYSAGALQRAFVAYEQELVTEPNFVCMAEILLKLRGMHLKMVEVPMILRYDRKVGSSKMSVGRTALESLALIARKSFRTGRSAKGADGNGPGRRS